jgi:TolA-binding protein
MTVSWEPAGKGFEADPRLPALIRVLEEATAESLGRLRGRLGICPGALPIRWTIDVSAAPPPARPAGVGVDGSAGDSGFFEGGRTAFEGGGIVVSVPARKYLERPSCVAPVVAHEASHAAMASAIGSRDRYEAIPRWFREGVAVWFAGEGKTRVDEMIAGSLLAGGAASAFLAGIPGSGKGEAGGDRVTHAEAFLALLWFERRLGEEGLKTLIAAAAKGEDVIRKTEDLTGLRLEAARALALDSSREEVRRRIDAAEAERFGASLRLRAEGRGEEAAIAWRSLLDKHPEGPLVPTLLYFLARAGLDGTVGEEAAAEAGRRLDRLLALPGAPWRAEALILQGERLRARGDVPAAARAWREVLEAYGEDPVPAARAVRLLEQVGGSRQ